MPTDRWREYMRDIKEIMGLTFKDIAEGTGGMMSTETVQNLLAPSAKGDVTRETARLIENAIFGSSNAHPCPIDIMETIPAEHKKIMDVEEEMAALRKNIALIHDSYNEELSRVRAEAQKKIDHLKDQIEYLRSINDCNARIIDRLMEK